MKKSAAEMAADDRKPRNIARMASPPASGARTTYVPMMDDSTPMPRTISG